MDMQHHFAISSSDKVSRIVKPLTSDFNIKHFRYLKLYRNGSRVILSNYPDCTRFMYQDNNYKKMWFDGEFPEKLTAGWHAWDVMRTITYRGEISPFEKEINLLLDLYHGLTFIIPGSDFYEIYSFDSNRPSIYQIDYKLLKYFILYFKEQAKSLIEKGEHEKIILPMKKITHEQSYDDNQAKIDKFITNHRINRFYLDREYRDIYLTAKEAHCAYWLIQGKSAEEISIILGNKNRTIEVHIENIRRKLNCSKQTQIVRILIEKGFLNYHESIFI